MTIIEQYFHSARSPRAVGVRDAIRPRIAATMLARKSAPTPMRTTEVPGNAGDGTASISCANASHKRRPRAIPTGIPTIVPIRTAMLDCQATTAANCRLVNPSVFNSATSRRRRRIEATKVRPRAISAVD
jgi:hypothetical protein